MDIVKVEKEFQRVQRLEQHRLDKAINLILEGKEMNLILAELKKLSNINAVSLQYDLNPLMAALLKNNELMVDYLLAENASLVASNKFGNDVISFLIDAGYQKLVRESIRKIPKLALHKNSVGKNRLMQVVGLGNLHLTQFLLASGVNKDDKDELERTALHYNLMRQVYTEQDREIFLLLLDLGLNPLEKDKKNLSGFEYAFDNEFVYDHLLEKGYDVEKPSKAIAKRALKEKDFERYLTEENAEIYRNNPNPDLNLTKRPMQPQFNGPKYNAPKI